MPFKGFGGTSNYFKETVSDVWGTRLMNYFWGTKLISFWETSHFTSREQIAVFQGRASLLECQFKEKGLIDGVSISNVLLAN